LILERICLEDFGIFRNQIMEGIHPGLVVITGSNRAGKTTFMKALRYLGYGLPRNPSIPPCSGQQHVLSADLRLHDGSRYTLQLTGFGAPKVSPLKGSRETEIEDIYSHLDSFTYRQVFTISLDELRRIPEDTTSGEEQRLQAVLLGAGWTDIHLLMQVCQEFGKKADAIGGRSGSKNVGQFKPYNASLRDGIAQKDLANNQMGEFYRIKEQLAFNESRLSDLQKALEQNYLQLDLHELLRDHFETSQQITRLLEELEDPENSKLLDCFPGDGLSRGEKLLDLYIQVMNEYDLLCSQFEASVGIDKQKPLLEQGNNLDTYEKLLSGWRQNTLTLERDMAEHRDTKNDLAADLQSLHWEWGKDLTQLDRIRLDLINEEMLLAQVDAHREKHQQWKDCTLQMEKTRAELEQKEKDDGALKSKRSSASGNLLRLTAAGLVGVLLSAAVFDYWVALAVGIVAAAGIITYFLFSTFGSKTAPGAYLSAKVAELKDELSLLEKEKGILEQEMEESAVALKEMLETAGLPKNLPYSVIPDFIKELRGLKKRYLQWLSKGEGLREQISHQDNVLAELERVLREIGLEQVRETRKRPSPNALYDAIETACTYLSAARELNEVTLKKERIEKDILELLREETGGIDTVDNLSDALEAFISRGRRFGDLQEKQQERHTLEKGLATILATQKNRSLLGITSAEKDTTLIEVFARFCSGFNSFEELREICTQLAEKRQDLIDQIERIKNEIVSQELRSNQLATDENLHNANRMIVEARLQLERKAEEYAVFRLAEHLVKNTYEQLLEKAREAVLGDSSKIFSRITSEEYREITMPIDGKDRDFTAIPSGSKKALTTNALSRGTREQLFLSVRLSRIKSIHPPLPVILDDSMANFDPSHAREAVKLIAELAETHQVFVLTCHPELLQYIESTGCPAQYWKLDKGIFSGPLLNEEAAAALYPKS